MERVELIRKCDAVQVPVGNVIMLEKGVQVFITQFLGRTYTIQVPAYGGLYRIASKDADALGKTPEAAVAPAFSSGDLEAMVWDQLKTCFDPEIPVNIVDLGLVYGLELISLPDGTHKVDVDVVWDPPWKSADDLVRETRAPRPGLNPPGRFLELEPPVNCSVVCS